MGGRSPAPPGWYPDPHDPARRRWWDGSEWHDAPPPMKPLFPRITEARRVVLAMCIPAAALSFSLMAALILVLGAPSDPCRAGEPCGPEPFAVAGPPLPFAALAVAGVAGAILIGQLSARVRAMLGGAAVVLASIGWWVMLSGW